MSVEVRRQGDLDISQDMDVQNRIWRMQRIGWGIIALILLGILLGLTGRGPLSNATAGETGDPLRLEYERFGRYEAPTSLRIHLGPNVAKSDKVALWFSRQYLEGVQIDQITPEQESVKSLPGKFIYEFQLARPQNPAIISIKLRPQKIGSLQGRLGVESGQSLSFGQLIYP
jgi:hypothetical protein